MKTISWDEIVFRDRNRNYGAYYLRKKYYKTVILSFLGALLIVFGLVGVPLVQAMRQNHNSGLPDHDISITINNVADPYEAPPPPPPPPPPVEVVKKLTYVPYLVVDTTHINLALVTTEEIIGSDINQPIPEKLEVNNDKNDAIPEDLDRGTFFPTEPATFMDGDLAVFHAWVEKNIVYPQAAMDNAIFGKVIVQFAINKLGELVDIKLLRSVDKTIDEETIRVLMMSPKWRPAKQGGSPVKQLYTMPVSFVLK
jgi:periplasmic protein TonB